MDAQWINLIITVVKIVVVVFIFMLPLVMLMTLMERRISAFLQDRLGPNRVGPMGILQPIADGLKAFFKEDIFPVNVDRFLYLMAPAIILFPALITVAIVPFGDQMSTYIGGHLVNLRFQIADLNIGILYFVSFASLGVYGLVVGGYASNNKYSMLGGLRSSAQMISYEIPMGLAIVAVVMRAQSLSLNDIVLSQATTWNFLYEPIGFIIFVVASFAETNRLPFDLPEAEQELVGGYHTEYSSMKFSAFFIAEYSNMIVSSMLITTLFLGGWQVPFGIMEALNLPVIWEQLIQILAFLIKTGIFLFIYLWVRWTLPRFRYDQLMNLGWKSMLPLGLFNILLVAVQMKF